MGCSIDPRPPSKFRPWGTVLAERPELDGRGSAMLARAGLAYLATVSKVGRPRVTPVSVVFEGGALLVSLIRSTPKCRELQANPFFHLHALPGPGGEEFSLRGWARIVVDDGELAAARQAHATSGVICGDDDVIFELLLDRVHFKSSSKTSNEGR